MENMKIVVMNGGLGNQLYQYAFIRFLEMATKEKCIIDDSAFFRYQQHNGYEMENVFGLKLNLLSKHFTEDVWAEMIRIWEQEGISIPQQLLDNGINLTMLAEFKDHVPFNGNIVYMPPNSVSKEVMQTYINTKGNFYYHGYWVKSEIVNSVKATLLKELVFPELEQVPGLPAINQEYLRKIKETDSVALHIRRGDFLQCGRALSGEKYARSVAWMEERHTGCTYFVFSDDISWCEEHKEELGLSAVQGEVVYVQGNTGNGYNYVDMQLMSNCKHMIISNSSFGFWAFHLNKTSGGDVILADNM